jgi:alcohol dehydrogenase class IV
MEGKINFLRTPKIIFGNGRSDELPDLLKGKSKKVLIVCGLHSSRQNSLISKIIDSIQNDFNTVIENIGNEPSPADIDKIVHKCHHSTIPDCIVAIGGGSVLDTGKAVSAMIPVEGSVKDYLEVVGSKIHNGDKIYFIAVPTTSGTGSEATSNAVISETGKNGFKRSLRHDNFVPDIALVDPLLTLECPPEITAHSGMDAFTQLLESFLSVKSNPLTDAIAFEGLKEIHANLLRAVHNGSDPVTRSGMSYAALLSGISIINAGLGLIHGFASSIGGLFRIPHGVVCGTLMGVVNRYNIQALKVMKEITPAHLKYASFGQWISKQNNKDLHWYMDFTAGYIDDLTEKLNIQRLGYYGVTDADLDHITESTDHKANPVTFEQWQLSEMLRKRL